MAVRKAWEGAICLAPGVPFAYAEALTTATSKKSGPFRELCAHCTKPIDRSHKCPETGQVPPGKAKGVERPDGSFAVVSDADIALAKTQTANVGFELLACEPLADCPIESAESHYWLQAPKKQQGFLTHVAALYGFLIERKLAFMGKTMIGDRQCRVAIYPRAGKLWFAKLRYADELNDAPPTVLALAQATQGVPANPMLLEMLDKIVAAVPSHLDMSAQQDESLAVIQPIIDRALSGATPAPAAPEAEPASVVPDLLGDLNVQLAALEASQGKAKKPATAKPAKEVTKA